MDDVVTLQHLPDHDLWIADYGQVTTVGTTKARALMALAKFLEEVEGVGVSLPLQASPALATQRSGR